MSSYKEKLNDITTFILDVDGVLTDGTVLVNTLGEQQRRMNIKDGYALKSAIDADYNICIISGGSNEGVRVRLKTLGITDIHLGVKDKTLLLQDYFEENDIQKHQVAYMGDDIPDYPAMQLVGLPTCPQDAVPEIKAISDYISHRDGGCGCVRDLIEQVMKVQGKWMMNLHANNN